MHAMLPETKVELDSTLAGPDPLKTPLRRECDVRNLFENELSPVEE